MNRRAAIRAALAPSLLVIALLSSAAAASPAPEPPPTPITVNEFIPEQENIGECLGALERPGCGSKARGGWRQTMVFVVMLVGVVVVFGRVGLSVHRSRQRAPDVP